MRLIVVHRDGPIEEIAAEADTLAAFAVVLDRARTQPAVTGRLLSGGRGLLALPRITDPSIPPMTVHLRPHRTAPIGTH